MSFVVRCTLIYVASAYCRPESEDPLTHSAVDVWQPPSGIAALEAALGAFTQERREEVALKGSQTPRHSQKAPHAASSVPLAQKSRPATFELRILQPTELQPSRPLLPVALSQTLNVRPTPGLQGQIEKADFAAMKALLDQSSLDHELRLLSHILERKRAQHRRLHSYRALCQVLE